MKLFNYIFVLLVTTVCLGCGEKLPEGLEKLYSVELMITQESQPLEGAMVSLTATDKSQSFVMGGMTGSDGKVTVFTQGKYKGAPAGKYKVRVEKTETSTVPPPPALASPEFKAWEMRYGKFSSQTWSCVEKIYTRTETTPLEIEITGVFTDTLDVGKAVRDSI